MGYRLHKQFELPFLCFERGAPATHFLLNNEILMQFLLGEASREMAVVDGSGQEDPTL